MNKWKSYAEGYARNTIIDFAENPDFMGTAFSFEWLATHAANMASYMYWNKRMTNPKSVAKREKEIREYIHLIWNRLLDEYQDEYKIIRERRRRTDSGSSADGE